MNTTADSAISKLEFNYSFLVVSLVFIIHALPFFAFFTPFSVEDFWLFCASYAVRVFSLTAGYHRYFSHKAFETSRVFQFILAYFAACSLQGGPLWWASSSSPRFRRSFRCA